MAHILITGGSGSIGRRLINKLREHGHSVAVIGRSIHKSLDVPSFTWDLQKGTLDERALKDVTHIIHLAGAGIADKPWSPSRKQEIIESRVKPLQLLSDVLKKRNQRIEAIISSSAVGYYGAVTSEKIFTEDDAPANDFLGSTCKMWEAAVQSFKPVADREVRVRTGIVLMKGGGALPKLATPVRFGVGAAIGSGKQWMPWIHIDDMTSIYLHAVENNHMHGAYNAVALESATQSKFIQKIGKSLNRPVFLPSVPKFLVSTVMGEMAKVVTEGSRVSSQKIMDAGFEFKHPQLQEALNDLLQ
ncbi:MAG: TIGR01777 family protein [Flavobacteriales bacterium]|nr:TIGR01777 family protein [Flavobacteriales bacterium]